MELVSEAYNLKNINQNEKVLSFENLVALDKEVVLEVIKFVDVISQFGIYAKPYTLRAIAQLSKLEEQKKHQIIRYFSKLQLWISEYLDSQTDLNNLDRISLEKHLLKNTLNESKAFIDDKFWSTLEKNTIVEIYNEDMIQLYRSLNFFDHTNYSALDLSVYEWYYLWERPKVIQSYIFDQAVEAVKKNIPLKKFEVKTHIVREILESGNTEPFTPQAGIVNFHYITSLSNGLKNESVGLLATCSIEMIADGDEALNIHFV